MLDSKQNTYFINFDSEPLDDAIMAEGSLRSYPTGVVLLEAGTQAEYLYYILEGEIAVTAISQGGEEKNIFFVKNKMFYGEAHVFADHLNLFRITAAKPVKAVLFGLDKARRLFADNERFRERFLISLSQKAFAMSAEIASLVSDSSEERIYNCLLDLEANRKNRHDERIRITQQEISTILGMHRVTVSRALNRLEERGLIKRGRNHIQLIRP
ncbi:Crp/Fnr family transcriptional regulator [Desulfovibrio sp. OttesenSCG-928-C06]|nr:Crp/Fnr family transcriptional regulator [Desulfovibrio sp. OttesenSCG-928-C06]